MDDEEFELSERQWYDVFFLKLKLERTTRGDKSVPELIWNVVWKNMAKLTAKTQFSNSLGCF